MSTYPIILRHTSIFTAGPFFLFQSTDSHDDNDDDVDDDNNNNNNYNNNNNNFFFFNKNKTLFIDLKKKNRLFTDSRI